LANPWALPTAAATLAAAAAAGSLPAAALLATGAALALYRPYRTWATMQAYLIAAAVKNLWDKDSVWQKQEKHLHAKPTKPPQISTETAQRYTAA